MEHIDELVNTIKGQDYDDLLEINNINFYEGSLFFDRSIVSKSGDKYLFLAPHLFNYCREFAFGHELGHILLNHHSSNTPYRQAEMEANYFSEQLTDKSRKLVVPLLVMENIYLSLTSPDYGVGAYLEKNSPVVYREFLVDVMENHPPIKYN